MAVQWPLIAARLLELFPTLPGWGAVSVHDGAAYDSVKQIFCTVGHSDDGVATTAGTFDTVQSDDGFQYIETGQVACQLCFNKDNATPADARAALFPLLNQIDAAIRNDRTLGVLSPDSELRLNASVHSAQTIPGLGLTVLFSVDYVTST